MVTLVPCRQQGWWLSRDDDDEGLLEAMEEGRGVCTPMGTAILWAPQSHSSTTSASPGQSLPNTSCFWQNCRWEANSGMSMAEFKICVWTEVRWKHFLDCDALGLANNWSLEMWCFSDLMCSVQGGEEDPSGRESPCPDSLLWTEPFCLLHKPPSCCRDPHSDGEPICCPTPHRMSHSEPQVSQNYLVY